MMKRAKLSIILLLASFGLLIIYGADTIVAASRISGSEQTGFLPINASVRGSAFGGGAVVASIIAFVISRKEHSPAITILLILNGGLILTGMIFLTIGGALSSGGGSAVRTVVFTIATGGVLVGLGAYRVLMDTKFVEQKKTRP